MPEVHTTATTRIFSHKYSLSPLPVCSLVSHSDSSRRSSGRLHWYSCGKLPVSRVCRTPPAPLTLHCEKRGARNKAFLQPRASICWTPQPSEQPRLGLWLSFTIWEASPWVARQLHFPVCHQHETVAHCHRAPHLPPSWKCFLRMSTDGGFHSFPN